MRGIFYYLWDINIQTGARALMMSYAELFRRRGITLDLCYLHSKKNGK